MEEPIVVIASMGRQNLFLLSSYSILARIFYAENVVRVYFGFLLMRKVVM
jgi:hypothetical protein